VRYSASASRDEVVYVVSSGWHTELGLPVTSAVRPFSGSKWDVNSAVKATAHGTNHSAEFENICRLQLA
jgi:hypothetical protein